MSSLMERIAAKKALEAAAQEKPAFVQQQPSVVITEAAASVPEVKPLSFAEKMALKKLSSVTQIVATSTGTTATAGDAKSTETPSPKDQKPSEQSILTEKAKEEVPAAIVVGIVAAVAEEEDHEASIAEASPADQQAYYDIKAKINMLADMSEANLPGAMKELKGALLKNPQACYLILPQDIGQMVIALRTMKNEAVVEASTAKEKGPKKAKASKQLTAEEIAQAFDEL